LERDYVTHQAFIHACLRKIALASNLLSHQNQQNKVPAKLAVFEPEARPLEIVQNFNFDGQADRPERHAPTRNQPLTRSETRQSAKYFTSTA
jgi:hypothetical protein